jgi:hypothetical protein
VGEAKRRLSARDGVIRTIITDEGQPDRFFVHTQQDVEPILDSIHRDREIMRHGVDKLAARIPLFLYEELQREGITEDNDAFKRWLNGPEGSPWRIWKGQL